MARSKKKTPYSKEMVKEKLNERRKASKQLLKEKRARLIIRNLPFTATEENLREYFEKYGEVANVELLQLPDGKLMGCGFVQFKLVQKAAKAKHHTNAKPFLGRDILVDFAKAKDKYQKEIKKEQDDSATVKVEVKEEPIDVDEIKEEELPTKSLNEENETLEDIEEIVESDSESEAASESDEDVDDEEIDEDDEELDDEKDKLDVNKEEERKPRVISNDVSEGKTIFVKNIPFTATNDDLKQCMYQFGPIYYALICMDKITEHSKGTGFVKFQYKEDADKALEAGTELTLLGNVLDCHIALGRNEIHKKNVETKEQKKEPKDSRNLYLVKEGVILAGTKAAEGVSASDMAKRLQLEQYKTQMLRKLNMFISRERVVAHNLPATWDDNKLRVLFQKYGGPGAVIKEARIMRDRKMLDANGLGKSKEFGFVAFTKHEHALNALRSLNNNPNIFSAQKRPIVTFSIESKSAMKVKQKRMEKSRQNSSTIKPAHTDLRKKLNKTKTVVDTSNVQEFSGVAAKPGIQKMRSRYKLTTQAKLHYENIKKEKKKLKNAKKSFAEKKEQFTKQEKQKINNKQINDDFSKIVNNYKKLIDAAPAAKKAKWYE